MTVKWIKLTTNMFDDEKIKLIEQMPEADTILIIWIKLLSQAGKTNASGYIFLSQNIPYSDEMLATIFNRPLATVRLALQTLQQFGMISIDDNNFIEISNWEKHQNVEGLDKIREQTRKRVAKHREKQKVLDCNATVTLRNATEEELDIDIDKEYTHVREIFNHYLSKDIIKHQKITSAIRSSIKARLRDYTFEQLIQAIDNYSIIYKSDDYWFTHKYSLADLMRDKDIRRFIDDAEPLKNFAKNKPTYSKATNDVQPVYKEFGGKEY